MVERPTWVEISLDALRENYRALNALVTSQTSSGQTTSRPTSSDDRSYPGQGTAPKICCVVKCNAYGHGAVECARALAEAGAEWMSVSSVEEALALRDAGVKQRILLLSGYWPGQEAIIASQDLTPAIWSVAQVADLDAAAYANGTPLRVHLKVDTGMGRLGALVEELPRILAALRHSKNIQLEGVMSHLASAEAPESEQTRQQLASFSAVVNQIAAAGFDQPLVHLANSAAMTWHRGGLQHLVRPGISLYGYYLSSDVPAAKVRPVLSWKTRVLALKDLKAGSPVGYNGAYVTPADTRIAVLPVGYGDGLSRQLSNSGRVIVRDRYAPIRGKVSMDLTLVDVTDIPGVELGDEVIVLGKTEHCEITAWEHAELGHTIPYEVLCNIGARVPRVFL